jgi:hypothetical protein
MRYVVTVLAIFLTRSALAEDLSASLFGSWRLISFQLKIVGAEGEPKDIFGPNPIGRIIFSPEHRVVVFISKAGRRPPTNESEAAALLASMTAYTGKFRLDGISSLQASTAPGMKSTRARSKFDTSNLSVTN